MLIALRLRLPTMSSGTTLHRNLAVRAIRAAEEALNLPETKTFTDCLSFLLLHGCPQMRAASHCTPSNKAYRDYYFPAWTGYGTEAACCL